MLGSLHQTAVVDALQEEAGLTDRSWWAAADDAVRWLDSLCQGRAKYSAYGDANVFLEEAKPSTLRAKSVATSGGPSV